MIREYYLKKLNEGFMHPNITKFFDKNVLEDFLNLKILEIEKSKISKNDDLILTLQTKNIKNLTINIYEMNEEKFLREQDLDDLSAIDTTGFHPNHKQYVTFESP